VTRVKICGLTMPEEALVCRQAGADYLGLVFAGGPRLVDVATARAIRDAVPEARLVGVFMDQEADEVAEIAAECGLDFLQLHGSESEEDVRDVAARTGLPVIKALRADGTPSAAADFVLFDLPKSGGAPDERPRLWARAREAVEAGYRVFLAGKLIAEDVRAAVAAAAPFALDVSSGVESSPGRKDAALVRGFMEEIRHARA